MWFEARMTGPVAGMWSSAVDVHVVAAPAGAVPGTSRTTCSAPAGVGAPVEASATSRRTGRLSHHAAPPPARRASATIVSITSSSDSVGRVDRDGVVGHRQRRDRPRRVGGVAASQVAPRRSQVAVVVLGELGGPALGSARVGSAVRKIFRSASGATTVPMSRPSTTIPPSPISSRCRADHQRPRPAGTALTALTAAVTGSVRISRDDVDAVAGDGRARRGRCPSSTEPSRRRAATASRSSMASRERSIAQVTARYIAPVSR